MNGATHEETREGLNPTDYVTQAGVWVPRSSVTAPAQPAQPQPAPDQPSAATPSPARPLREASTVPGLGVDRGDQVMTVATGSGHLTAATGLQAATPAVRPGLDPSVTEELPDGVLARISNGMATAIGVVALVGMAEAAFNLGRFVLDILQLPLPLAIGFPAIFEIAAATFAVQDARDRRQGHANRGLRVATYLTLVASSAVNGIVGFASHGLGGLIEIVPPLMLAGVIHLHGDRATRAHHSQAVLRPAWRQAQLQAARRASVIDVLPLLLGSDEHARATVASLSHLLTSGNLEPSQALLAAGWFERFDRDLSPSMLRRLETVAATVWGSAGPPIPARPPLPEPVTRPRPTGAPAGTATATPPGSVKQSPSRSTPGSMSGSMSGSTTRSEGSSSGSSTGSTTRSSSGSSTRSGGGSSTRSGGGSSDRSGGSTRTIQELRARSIEDLIGELKSAVETGALNADSTITAVREHLQVHPDRARTLHKHLSNPTATPPQLRVLSSPDQVPSPYAAAGAPVPATDAEGAR